ncbi:MAG: hypothetical protein IKH75_00855 [Ruminococcus sp.]|nr:hypothetical protein [Ruminococcus sp.]
MSAPKLFLTSNDIAAVTGMSVRSAQNMLCMFARKGQVVRCGDSNRGRMVDINILVSYLCEQDGADPEQRKKDIKECLRENGQKHTMKDVRP